MVQTRKYVYNLTFNCTKEVSFSLLKSKKLALDLNSRVIEPVHLAASILLFNTISLHLVNFISKHVILKSLKKITKNGSTPNPYTLTQLSPPNLFSIKLLKVISNLLDKLKRPINTLDLMVNLFLDADPVLTSFFKDLNIKQLDLEQLLKVNLTKNIYQENLNFLKTFSQKVFRSDVKIIGRSKETLKLLEILNRQKKRNVLLIGEVGIGRHFIVNKILTWGQNQFVKNLELWNLNISVLLKFSAVKKDFDILFTKVMTEINQKKRIIFVCSDIHLLFSNSKDEQDNNLSTIIKSLISSNTIQFLNITTVTDYTKQLTNIDIIEQYFETLFVSELTTVEIKKILTNYAHKLELLYGVYILPETLSETLNLSTKYLKFNKFPEKALYVLDAACMKSLVQQKNFNSPKKLKEIHKVNVQQAISDVSKIPINLISTTFNKQFNLKHLENLLKSKIFGQDKAIIQICNAITRAQAGLKPQNKPIGSWIFCGPSGTGKTELSKIIAQFLFGSESEMIRFDMSEFMEKHSVSRLIGAPPGYIGYGEGGQLLKQIQQKPYSVILFDEIEKAHEDVNNLMLQLLDEGRLTDSSGIHVDFSNTLIIFTSNLGCSKLSANAKVLKKNLELKKETYKVLATNIKKSIKQHFKPEFLNRLDSIIIFKPLTLSDLLLISNKFFDLLRSQLSHNHLLLSVTIKYEVKQLLSKLAYNPFYGARPLKRLIEKFIEKPISDLILTFNLQHKYNLSFFINKQLKTLNYSLIKSETTQRKYSLVVE